MISTFSRGWVPLPRPWPSKIGIVGLVRARRPFKTLISYPLARRHRFVGAVPSEPLSQGNVIFNVSILMRSQVTEWIRDYEIL